MVKESLNLFHPTLKHKYQTNLFRDSSVGHSPVEKQLKMIVKDCNNFTTKLYFLCGIPPDPGRQEIYLYYSQFVITNGGDINHIPTEPADGFISLFIAN